MRAAGGFTHGDQSHAHAGFGTLASGLSAMYLRSERQRWPPALSPEIVILFAGIWSVSVRYRSEVMPSWRNAGKRPPGLDASLY